MFQASMSIYHFKLSITSCIVKQSINDFVLYIKKYKKMR